MKEEGGSSVDIEILGRKLRVGSKDNVNSEHIIRVAKYVDQEMRNTERSLGTATSIDIAIITAMTIADKNIRNLEQQTGELSVLLDKSERLINFIDERMS